MKVETYKLKDWEDLESGLLIAENEEWILVKNIPIDYIVDGYSIYKKEFIESRTPAQKAVLIERVLELKKIDEKSPDLFAFSDTIGLLKWVEDRYGIFEFQDDIEDELFYGKINSIVGDRLIIDMIKSDGSVEIKFDFEFEISKIRVITFETDYHSSVRLLWNDEMKNK